MPATSQAFHTATSTLRLAGRQGVSNASEENINRVNDSLPRDLLKGTSAFAVLERTLHHSANECLLERVQDTYAPLAEKMIPRPVACDPPPGTRFPHHWQPDFFLHPIVKAAEPALADPGKPQISIPLPVVGLDELVISGGVELLQRTLEQFC